MHVNISWSNRWWNWRCRINYIVFSYIVTNRAKFDFYLLLTLFKRIFQLKQGRIDLLIDYYAGIWIIVSLFWIFFGAFLTIFKNIKNDCTRNILSSSYHVQLYFNVNMCISALYSVPRNILPFRSRQLPSIHKNFTFYY